MARVRFLAPTTDPRAGQEGIVYGPGHETDFQAADGDFVKETWLAGKLEVIDWTGITLAGFENYTEAAASA